MTDALRTRPLLPSLLPALLALALAAGLSGCAKQDQTDTSADAAQAAAASKDTAVVDAAGGAASASPAASAAPVAVDAAPAELVPVPGTDAAIAEIHANPALSSPNFDPHSFAGSYSDGSTRLDVDSEGQFMLDRGGNPVTGSWSLQAGGKTIVLDPDSKSEPDRLLQIEADGSVRIAGGGPLRRQ